VTTIFFGAWGLLWIGLGLALWRRQPLPSGRDSRHARP
jgi:hypothetical protein